MFLFLKFFVGLRLRIKSLSLVQKGVTIPSQRRYIEYYADFLLKKRVYEKIDLYLKSILIDLNEVKKDWCKSKYKNYIIIFF